MKILEGLGVALATPFNGDKSIDFNGLGKLLKHTKGVDYWVLMGSTGESVTLSTMEQMEILHFVSKNNPNNLPIVLGVGSNNTNEVINRLKDFDLSLVTAILSSSPAYNKPTQDGIIQHFEAIAESSTKPIILYNVPGRTASNITASTTITLSKHPNIIGIKEASGDLFQIMKIISSVPDDFMVISGDDLLTPAIISIGGKGLISVLANALPNELKEMITSGLNEDFKSTREQTFKLLELNSLMYEEGNPTGIKELLNQLTICNNTVRLPLVSASKELSLKINKALKNKGNQN